ncbi:hypothetical protein GE061_008028 [Apolygus lucorum]|uniref:Uncharacterized protein n=1 Tax=Apolygus lucorum TaxID=248454 RepID=A0A6A4J441_APOLU|nr:hypothetical protein GE061_008028 [Apolygus lucorum]
MRVILLISVFVLVLQGLVVAQDREFRVVANCNCSSGVNKPDGCEVCRSPAPAKRRRRGLGDLFSSGLQGGGSVCHCEIPQ